MSGKVNRVSTQVLQRFLGGTAPAWNDPMYINLLTAAPSDDGTNAASPTAAEWSADRVAVYANQVTAGLTAPYWSAPQQLGNLMYIANARTITWDGTALASVGVNIEVVAIGVFESSGTTQDLVYWDDLDVPRIINNGDYFEFGTNRLKIRED